MLCNIEITGRVPCAAPGAVPPPPRSNDHLPPAQRHAAIAAILVLHGVAAWGLLQVQAVRDSLVAAAPMFVDLLAPPAPEVPRLPPPPATPAPPRPTPPKAVTAAAPRPEPAPAPFVAPVEPVPPEPVLAPAPPAPPTPPAPPAPPAPPPPPPAPPAPTLIPPSAIQYLVLPDVVYPSASRRLGEQGLVVVAVFVDTEGVPQQVEVVQSSGFDRLDRAAVAGVRKARFRPYTEHGRPMAGWARIPTPFELEN